MSEFLELFAAVMFIVFYEFQPLNFSSCYLALKPSHIKTKKRIRFVSIQWMLINL